MGNSRQALLFGATGLVGTHLLHEALVHAPGLAIAAVTRRPLPVRHPRLANLVTDLSALGAQDWPAAVDIAFCCLGTTLRAAGSRAAFRAVDHDLVLRCARWSRQVGVRHFLVVSAIGADARSPLFYNRVKGETEQALAGLGFERLTVVQPSLLLGAREEVRTAEDIGIRLAPVWGAFMRGPLAAYRPVAARDVARAMLAQALHPAGGPVTHLRYPAIMAAAAALPAA